MILTRSLLWRTKSLRLNSLAKTSRSSDDRSLYGSRCLYLGLSDAD